MKLLRIFLLLSFLGIFAASQDTNDDSGDSLIESNSFLQIPSEKDNNNDAGSFYHIQAKLIPEKNILEVNELITWMNLTDFPVKEIQLHLRANSFKNNKTEYSKNINIPAESRTGYRFEQAQADGFPVELNYISTQLNEYDSTVASIQLIKEIMPGASIQISFKYRIDIPRAFDGLGYAGGRNFYFFSDWYPRIAEYKNGRWFCAPRENDLDPSFNLDNYHVEITVPDNFKAGGTGIAYSKGDENTFIFAAYGINNFAWFASDNVIPIKREYKTKNSRRITLKAFIQPENEKYTERYFNAINYSLEFLEKNIGEYPFGSLTLMDQPRTSFSEIMEFPSLISVRPELFSPVEAYYPEYDIVHGVVSQYFKETIKKNNSNSAWLGPGLSLYMTEKIMEVYYGKRQASFKLFGYYPIFGMNFLSYNEIPLIYTLGKFEIPSGSISLNHYYKDPGLSSVSDTLFADNYSRDIERNFKPELMMLSLERMIGWRKLSAALREYYEKYKFSEADSEDLIQSIKRNSQYNLDSFFNEVYSKAVYFDYKIMSISKSEEKNAYTVRIRRKGEGIFRQEIFFYTDKDTLIAEWDGAARWKDITFMTNNNPVGAEIDPKRKNILDLNYADNSYIINEQYAGSISLSLQYFFWMQNLLLVLGSIG